MVDDKLASDYDTDKDQTWSGITKQSHKWRLSRGEKMGVKRNFYGMVSYLGRMDKDKWFRIRMYIETFFSSVFQVHKTWVLSGSNFYGPSCTVAAFQLPPPNPKFCPACTIMYFPQRSTSFTRQPQTPKPILREKQPFQPCFQSVSTFFCRLVAFKTAVDLTQVAKAGFEEDAGTHSFQSQKYEKEEEKIQTSQIDPIKVAAVPG